MDAIGHENTTDSDSRGPGDALFDVDGKTHAQGFADALAFQHHRPCKGACAGIGADIFQRRTGQRADRVERQIAPELHPDFIPDTRFHWGLQTAGTHRFGKGGDALRLFARRFPQGEAVTFDVLDDGGTFVAKVLAGGAEGELQKLLKQKFAKVANVKPPASRADSSEKFVVATGFRG